MHLNIALSMVVSLYSGGKSHVSIGCKMYGRFNLRLAPSDRFILSHTQVGAEAVLLLCFCLGFFVLRLCQMRARSAGRSLDGLGVLAKNTTNTAMWVWLKIKQAGLRRFWSMFPLTRVPFWYWFFEPQPCVFFVTEVLRWLVPNGEHVFAKGAHYCGRTDRWKDG